MPELRPDRPVKVDQPRLKVEPGLPAGRYEIELVVVNRDGVASEPVVRTVEVVREGPGGPGGPG